MRKILNKILRILDGAPQPQTRGAQAGQSLVELAFITPLLAIMVVGIVEIGWYANRYLIMLEVSRVGARAGTVLSGELSPLSWNEDASVHPVVYVDGLGKTLAQIPPEARNYRDCETVTRFSGFYNFIACTMVNSLKPQVLSGRGGLVNGVAVAPYSTVEQAKQIYNRQGTLVGTIPYPDDIVVSVFATQAVNNASPASIVMPNAATDARQYQLAASLYSRTFNFEVGSTIGRYPAGSQVIVVGRYPKRANECNLVTVGGIRSTNTTVRDPFDYITNNALDVRDVGGENRPIELVGYDPPNPTVNEQAEAQLGFVWTAQHRRTDIVVGGNPALCWGSEFDDNEVAALVNLPNFIEPDPTVVQPWNLRRAALPSNGIVIVELFWQHNILLDFPFVEPIVAMFGDVNNIIISTWASFPVPSAEPNIVYGIPPN